MDSEIKLLKPNTWIDASLLFFVTGVVGNEVGVAPGVEVEV